MSLGFTNLMEIQQIYLQSEHDTGYLRQSKIKNRRYCCVNVTLQYFCQSMDQQKLMKEKEGDEFQILYPANKSKVKQCFLVVSETAISILSAKSQTLKQIKLQDAIGLIEQSKSEGFVRFRLFSYPKKKKLFSSEQRYIENDDFLIEENEKGKKMQEIVIEAITNRAFGSSLKLLICFNPAAGANSKNHLIKILDFIEKTNLQPEVFTTQHRSHCLEHLKTINQKQYCAVAIVSGDGLMHEFVNSGVNVPVTHVPAGSGNAFAKTQMTKASQLCKDEESIFLVVKNRQFSFSLIKFELEKEPQPIYSFLSLEWAIIADVDMNSQFLRCIGGLRFEVYAVWRIIKMKRYRGKITYSTTEKNIPPLDVDLDENPSFIVQNSTFLHTMFCRLPYIAQKFKMAPLVKLQQEMIDLQTITEENGRIQLIKHLLKSDSGSHFDVEREQLAEGMNFTFAKVKSFRLQPLDPQEPGILGIDGQAYESQKIQGSISDKKITTFI